MSKSHNAAHAEFVFGQPMKPCPKCGSYNMAYQMPIKVPAAEIEKMAQLSLQEAMSIAFALSKDSGEIEGPVYLRCMNCYHRGPAVDCTGRDAHDVKLDPLINKEVKRLWNNQKKEGA